MRKKMNKICSQCSKEYVTRETKQRFCSSSCSATYNNRNKPKLSENTKNQISLSVKKYYEIHPKTKKEKKKRIYEKKERVRTINSVLSLKNLNEIFKRIGLGCSNCGWNESSCQVHHIMGKKISDPDNHDNLSYLCPNCHRLAHEKHIKNVKTLNEYYKEHGINWRDFCRLGNKNEKNMPKL